MGTFSLIDGHVDSCCLFYIFSLPLQRQTRGMLLQEERRRVRKAESELCAVSDYGQTVQDINKVIKQTHPPRLRSLYPLSTFSTSG